MYLKSIEVHGFKSFANKILFEFHNGITGIVGPNGSGKSNVADAVRWVLGEQRVKQLRGGSMQDVIFSGTEMRKPLGYAYVAITLDNSDRQLAIDYDEVTVARRLYRSGESEYLINGSACRLKDVNEMFYDTGIGKEGYSIIGQGQIDAILSGKPEERRELFDEAAGIVKFKRRKSASEKKLEEERNNLVRVNDILAELERQVGPLEKQAEKAKTYLKKKEELKTNDVNLFLLDNMSVREQLDTVEGKYKIAYDDLTQSQEEFNKIKDEYERTAAKIEQLESMIEEKKNKLNETESVRGKLENQIELLKEQINSAKGNEEHLTNRNASVSKQVSEKDEEAKAYIDKKALIDERLKEATAKKEELRGKLEKIQQDIEDHNNDIESAKNTIIDTLNERATIKSRLERLETLKEQIDIKKSELTSKLVSAKTDEEKQQDVIDKLEKDFESISAEIEKLNSVQKEKESRVSEMKTELENMDNDLRDKQVKYHQDKSTLETLTNLTERYEGYGGSVKRVMEEKEKNKGIIGVVADIIKTDKKYEIAIETALGGNIQNIVTDDEETAKKVIALLKRERAGRATFLPLTSIKNTQEFKTSEVLEEKGVIGLADSLVKTKKEYSNVAKAMLGRIVVVDNVDNAVKIARKFDYGIRMVTLEGELLVPGGAISGGAFKKDSNLLSRRREMEELKANIEKNLKAIDKLLSDIEETKKNRNELRVEIEKIKIELQEKFINQNTIRVSLTGARNRQEENKADTDSLKNEAIDLEKQIGDNDLEKEEIIAKMKESEEIEKNCEKKIASLTNELEDKRKEESEVSDELSRADVDVEKIALEADFEQQNIERIAGEKERFEEELHEIVDKLGNFAEEIEAKNEEITKIEKTIAASFDAQNDTKVKLDRDIEEKELLSERQKNFFGKREDLNDRITALDKEVYRLDAQRTKLSDSMQAKIDYMWNEYEITLRDAEALRNPELNDLVFLKREVASLKDQIKRLGDVNVNAIEEFKEVSERYTFLKTQHDDLVEAEKTLVGIIEELDNAMRKQFKDKFSKINSEFDKVFKELFGGGTGTLELMEDQDILDAGVRIIAQPPGKKLQNMMQLSGGEKSLTAIALLFAIQNLKPSPFCLLDEIEAALDESNVGRFAKYLRKLTKHTQFIVITHRRGTMERADRLYGITMQEKGVSTLVSVNLIDDKDLN
ncbi:MAG: chromosome segregation protein SMC [Lachnospiraceae bacterium]|nr:chromosome segregation protein SMC [Lachnospiraceae bacterium]